MNQKLVQIDWPIYHMLRLLQLTIRKCRARKQSNAQYGNSALSISGRSRPRTRRKSVPAQPI